MKKIIAIDDVAIIAITLYKPIPPWSSDLGSLMPINATSITSVAKTAKWEIILLPFSIPDEQTKRGPPIITGISAVIEELSMYPQTPKIIRLKELIKFALYAFIVI